MRLNAKKHLYLTLKLLAPIYYVKVVGWDYPLSLITIKCDPPKGSIDHIVPQRLHHKPHPKQFHAQPSNQKRIPDRL
jgi:hypothetical protein